ncbi:hypothetical protein HDU98_003229, partial [Podochytrium sp. JEL0797]
HIALKNSHPYTLWNIKLLAANHSLSMRAKTPFIPETMYPLYVHRRTIGFDEKRSTSENEDLKRGVVEEGRVNCFTFAFWRVEDARLQTEGKKKKAAPVGNGGLVGKKGGEELDGDSD